MSYIEKTLVPGEHLIYKTRLHWIVMLGHVLLACALLVLAGFLVYYASVHRPLSPADLRSLEIAAIVLAVVAFIVFFLGSVRRNATEMAVTNRRVVIKKGIASRTTIEMLLNKVETIEVAEPTLGRILGYGSITMIGTGGTPESFHKMTHPLEFRSHVQQQIEKILPPQSEVPVKA